MADGTNPEARTAAAMEDLVGRDSFGELLARMTETVLGVMRIGQDVAEHVLFPHVVAADALAGLTVSPQSENWEFACKPLERPVNVTKY